MNTELSYCPHLDDVLVRLRKLFGNRSQEIILARMNPPNAAIEEFKKQNEEGFRDYPDPQARIEFWDSYCRQRQSIYDDSIPWAYMSEMDQGLYGGLFGGDVRFLCDLSTGWISSMVPPLLNDLSKLEELRFSTDNQWWQRYVNQLKVFAAGSTGKFGVAPFIMIDGLNFVFELIGATQTYLALSEQPGKVRQAIDLAYDVNLKVQETFFDYIPSIGGGTFNHYAQWLPGRIVSESVDPFHMTSVDYFEQWGREPVERIFDHFDGGVTHLHGNGRHLISAVAKLKGLRAIWVGDDDPYPPVIDVLAELKQQAGPMPLVCTVDYEKFTSMLKEHSAVPGVYYDVYGVPSVDEANRSMELVREYKA